MTPNQKSEPPVQNFYGLGIAPRLLDILDALKFVTPTPIQHKAIPIAIEGQDVIGIAQTGTGKTLAFAIPIIQRLVQVKGRALVLLPTRELAMQVDEVFQQIGRTLHLRTTLLIGGASMNLQISSLGRNPHVLIATPGRLLDHLKQKTIALNDISILILDEADRMLDMGFMPQIRQILQVLPKDRQTMLFSATMPDDIVRIAAHYMKTPVRTEIARPGTAAERVVHELFVVEKISKLQLLEKLLTEYHGTILVFIRTKFGAKKITHAVRSMGVAVAEIHSNRSLAQRKDAMEGFKSGKYRVLIATDIAARGIDVTGIELVINYDIPDNPEDYIHRIGRTGRAGMSGRAISFASPDQGMEIRQIERLARIVLPISKLPELPPARAVPRMSRFDGPPNRGRRPMHQHSPRPRSHAPQRRRF